MKISIVGHSHLAYVTAACMEQFHKVNVDDRKVTDSELIWVCYDTPVDETGKPSPEIIVKNLESILPLAKDGTVVVISSQVPVGTCNALQQLYPNLDVACSPENLRRGKAINDFMNPERIVVGCEQSAKDKIEQLFAPLNRPVFWTTVETAEMIKHAINSYLALSIAFINEIDKICSVAGANSKDVAYGLQSDKRIGFLSYLKPGGPYTNDTLGREIYTLIELDKKFNLGLSLFPAIKKSNDAHSNNR